MIHSSAKPIRYSPCTGGGRSGPTASRDIFVPTTSRAAPLDAVGGATSYHRSTHASGESAVERQQCQRVGPQARRFLLSSRTRCAGRRRHHRDSKWSKHLPGLVWQGGRGRRRAVETVPPKIRKPSRPPKTKPLVSKTQPRPSKLSKTAAAAASSTAAAAASVPQRARRAAAVKASGNLTADASSSDSDDSEVEFSAPGSESSESDDSDGASNESDSDAEPSDDVDAGVDTAGLTNSKRPKFCDSETFPDRVGEKSRCTCLEFGRSKSSRSHQFVSRR